MKTLTDIPTLPGVKVLVRVDFNVPIKNDTVADDFRIRKALPTIEYLKSKGARQILVSHIETAGGLVSKNDVTGISEDKPTLKPVADYLEEKGIHVTFVKNISKAFELSEHMHDGDIILIENIRENEGEKKNDQAFAEELASLADIYVNDAFSVSHREHASIVGVPQFMPSYAGIQLQKEIEQLSVAFEPSHPFVFVLGGAKFETKLPLINKFMNSADTICIGGALANDALKALGHNVGVSKVSKSGIDISSIVKQAKISVPMDVVIQDHAHKAVTEIGDMDAIYDLGTQTLQDMKNKIDQATFILWNGPLGLFEKGFTEGTIALAEIIAHRTVNGKVDQVRSIVGGGDTLSAISKLGVEDQFTFVSTGGGAMLDFLAQGTLPGIEALNQSEK